MLCMSFKPKFNIGDWVTKRRGVIPYEVITIPPSYKGIVIIRSTKSGKTEYYFESSLDFYNKHLGPKTMTQTLYSFVKPDGYIGYGIHIGTNSKDQFLIEENGSGDIHTLSKNDLEEVLPYTFRAKHGNSGINFIGTPDTLKVGDCLLCSSGYCYIVIKLDTKAKNAKKFEGVKLITEPV